MPVDTEFYWRVIPLSKYRSTQEVAFYAIPVLEMLKGLDLVLHENDAVSPGPVGDNPRPWYYHLQQLDNLIVTHGLRRVELYREGDAGTELFDVTPRSIVRFLTNSAGTVTGTEVLAEEPALLCWSIKVFHRIVSGREGSASVNLAVRLPEFSLKNNFDIYELDVKTGKFGVIREGFRDQT